MFDDAQRRAGYRLRRAVGPHLDRAVRTVVDETVRVYPEGYAGTVSGRVEVVESALSDAGFSWNPVSMYHYTPLGNRTNGSWVLRESPFADRQLHLVLVERGPERVDVYAHEENNWRRHPLRHVRDAGIDRDSGAERARSILEGLDLEHAHATYLRRKLGHLARRCRRWLDGRSLG
ncbi:hypothetical protein [Halosimplex halobium]|uniref:hypothetical protein n=1 Tax=Halosimplex halobium TaxID=3396618 RepID=UPI003F57F9EB